MIKKNIILKRPLEKPILWDAFYNQNLKKKPLVIFCHGYKGFKDWGAWDLVANAFCEANNFFVKFNFSLNGGTMEQPIDFPDLEAFGQNNYSRELKDLHDIIDYLLSNKNEFHNEIDPEHITLIGHSRGGGIVLIKASEDTRITRVITWAGVSDFGSRFVQGSELEDWKIKGVRYVLNGRTKQQMPHYYQFYEDFKAHEKRLNIKEAAARLVIPHLIIHGTNDEAVSYQEAKALHSWSIDSELYSIDGANHVFGTKHPWEPNKLPEPLKNVVLRSMDFIK